MRLCEFIRQHSQSDFADWSACVTPLAGMASRSGCARPYGYLPELLAAVADRMESNAATLEQPARPSPSGPHDAAPDLIECATRHSAERLAQHFTLNQVVEEYRALRAQVLRCWKNHPDADAHAAFDEVIRFIEVIDEALAAAIASYDQRLREGAEAQAALHQRLAESEQRFRALVNATSQVVYRLSPDGSEMRALDGRGTVVDTEHPTQSWLDKYVLPADQPLTRQAFREALANKRMYQVEHRYRRMSGRIGWTLSRAVPIYDERGEIVEWFGAATDVTARRQAEDALREADRRKDEFLAMLGHELRNPLAPLRTCVDLLAQARGKPELLDSLRPMMDRQLLHLVRLVDDLVDISRISRGRIHLQRVPLDLNLAVEAALEQAKAAIAARRHEMHVQLSPTPLPVQGDLVRLTQVVANLLNNAARYMHPGGTIHLCSAAEDGQAVVRVRDAGYGFPPELATQLFRLFSQISEHQAETQQGGGLGIGLALSRKLITLHGGTIEARSGGLGQGSEFIVRLELSQVSQVSQVSRA